MEKSLNWREFVITRAIKASGYSAILFVALIFFFHEAYERRGLGRLMVERIVEEARTLGLRRVMALTYVPPFFHKLGFRTVGKETLPEKVWGVCVKCYKYNNCDETAVLKELK